MKEIFLKIKTNPQLKAKVIRGGVFFVAFIIAIISYAIYNAQQPEKKIAQQEENQINGRIIPADTTSLDREKGVFYQQQNTDSIDNLQVSNGMVMGGSVVQKNKTEQDNNEVLNNYMNNRQASVQRMQNSGSQTSVPPSYSRRSYNPNGNSSDWTSEKTTVTGTKITTDAPVISASTYRRPYDPENSSASITPSKQIETQTTSTTNREYTKEEKLQNAIANKYNNSGNSNQSIAVSAEIYNSQTISANNSSVRIVLLDKLYINNTTIGTDAFIYGVANIGQNSIEITVPNISYKGKNYPLNLVVYDYRTGERGIPIRNDNIVGAIGKEAENQLNQEAGRLGRVGSVVSSVISGRNKSTNIQLNSGHKIYLKSK